MKKYLKISFAVIMTVLIIAVSTVSAFAKGTLTLDEKAKAKVGDTITYTLKLGDCKDKLEGIQMYIIYDKSMLEIDASSLRFPELKGAVSNPNYKKGIAFNWTSVTNLVSFEKTKTLMTVNFKVKQAVSTNITYFISEMYGEDMTYFKSFTLTDDISVNGEKVVKDATPVLCRNTEITNTYQGGFPNYVDGKGEENGSGKDHVQVTGVTTKPLLGSDDSEAVDVTKDGGNSTATTLVILGITLAVIAIIVLVILRRHFTKDVDSADNESGSESDNN